MPSTRRTWIAVLALLAAACLSAALLLKHYGVGTPADALCGEGPASGCDTVTQSGYSRIAGVPLAALGLVFYGSLSAALALSLLAGEKARAGLAKLALVALGASLLVDLGLLGVQALDLHAYCALCLATYAAGAIAFAALFPARAADAGPALAGAEGRLLLGGSALSGLVLLATAAVYQAALGQRPADPAALLGSAQAASGAGAPAGDAAEAEARRLQAILDDPQKLEQYFSDKAQREFEQAAVQSIELAGVPFKGPAEAPIKVVEYSDFLCPFCRSLAQGFTGYLPQTAGRVAIYFKNYPLDNACNTGLKQQVHASSCLLSLGALCAQEQGRFWQYHDRVFAREQKPAARDEVLRLATEAGLDAGALGSCLDKPATVERLQAELREGAAAGVKGTPTVFINGKRVPRLNDFVAMVDKEAARLGLPPLPASQAQAQPH